MSNDTSILRPVRAPAQYPVRTTSPVRIAGYNEAPFRVINLSNSATIWVSNNSGVVVGQGTPIYPGTSLQWVQASQLYAIADQPANVLVTTEIDDWQGNPVALATAIATQILNSGVILVDNPVLLYNFGPTAPFTSPYFDVTKYQSLNIYCACFGLNNTDDLISFSFSDSSNNITFGFTLSYTVVGQIWRGTVPCYAGRMQFNIGSAGTNLGIAITGSNRQIDRVRQRIQSQDSHATDFAYTGYSLAAVGGANVFSIDIPPWHGRIMVECETISTPAIAPGTSYVGVWRHFNGAFQRAVLNSLIGNANNGSWDVRFETYANGEALRFTVVNNTTSTCTGIIRITPVSGALV